MFLLMCLFNQSGGEEEKGPEPEPVREYTPAGRALKTKFAKLRARQKERLAKRDAVNESRPVEGLAGTESLMHSPAIAKGDLGAGLVHSVQEGTSVNTEDNKYAQLSETQNSNADSLSRIDKLSKHKMSNHFDVSVNNPGRSLADLLPPNHHNNGGINITNSMHTNNFAPVLGLCAPNANQIESSESNISKLNWRQNRHGARQEFPFSLAPCTGTSMDAEVRNKETAASTKLSDTLTENLQSFKNSIPDNFLPFVPFPFSVQGKESDAFDNSGARFSAFQEKMTLPNLPFDERLLARFPHTTKNIPNSHLDLLPNLSLGSRLEALNGSMQDLPILPALPTFKIPPEDLFRYNQKDRDVPPTLGLGQRPTTFSSFPENHRKVLENIMIRTGSGSGSSSLLKKKSKSDVWSEDELDSLWIGVRRHGRGNWDTMLRDPKLKFSKYKTSEDLSVRWEEEQVKIFQGPPFPVQRSSKTSKSTKSAHFPISDGMMERALQGSKFLLPPKFHNHMTDMKLGIGDSPSSLPHFRTMDQPSLQNNHFGSFPSRRYDVNRAKFPEDPSAETSDRPGTSSSVPTERPFLLNSFGSSSLSSFGLNCSGSIGLQQNEDDQRNKRGKLPVFLDGSPNDMRSNCINVGNGESTSSGLLSYPIKPDFVNSKGEEIAGSNSSKDKLPHWLREAVSSPPKLPDPELPPTVSAIAQSVRMLYGDDKPTIPPFVVPGPPPSLPKDPRCSLKKKKKRLHKPKQVLPDFAGSSKDFHSSHHVDNGASSSALLPPPFPLLPQTGTPGPQQMESDLNLPSLNLKVPNLSYSSVQSKKSNFGLSPSPEVLQLVASCVAPGPHISSIPSSSSFLEGELPLPRPVGVAKFKDSEGAFRNRKPREISPEVRCSPQEHKVEQNPDSGDSSKTQSDPSRVERPGKGESSSEGTVSDNSARDQET